MIDLKTEKILLTGGNGFLGKFVAQELIREGVSKENIVIPRRAECDLRKAEDCERIMQGIGAVIHLAANFDGLKYNTEHAAEVFYDNAAMGLHLVDAAKRAGVKKFVLAGTVGSYPKTAPIPFQEEDYWNGLPETGNDSYGLSKKFVAAQLMAYRQQFGLSGVNLILGNLYGPEDHFDLNRSNVIPALIHKFIDAKKTGQKEMVMWGTGQATREFLYIEDAARAVVLATMHYEGLDPVNIGSGEEVEIKYLAELLAKYLEFPGQIVWDATKPEGQKRRIMDVSKAKVGFGFSAQTPLTVGLEKTIQWYTENYKKE
jgi:GDP-L-fucose synthase